VCMVFMVCEDTQPYTNRALAQNIVSFTGLFCKRDL